MSIWYIIHSLCDKVCQLLVTGWWFYPGTSVSSTNKTYRHDIAEILLKLALHTTTLTLYSKLVMSDCCLMPSEQLFL